MCSSERMKITQITTTSRYAKLTDDTSFFIQYDTDLTEAERNTKWSVSVEQSPRRYP